MSVEETESSAQVRITKLIEEKAALKAQLLEAQAELKVTGANDYEAKLAAAVEAACAPLRAQIAQMESSNSKQSLRNTILSDGIQDTDADELLEYLQDKYSKVQEVASEDGTVSKPDFNDWYTSFKDQSKVVQSFKIPQTEQKVSAKPVVKPVVKPVATIPTQVAKDNSTNPGRPTDFAKLDPKDPARKAELARLERELFGKK